MTITVRSSAVYTCRGLGSRSVLSSPRASVRAIHGNAPAAARSRLSKRGGRAAGAPKTPGAALIRICLCRDGARVRADLAVQHLPRAKGLRPIAASVPEEFGATTRNTSSRPRTNVELDLARDRRRAGAEGNRVTMPRSGVECCGSAQQASLVAAFEVRRDSSGDRSLRAKPGLTSPGKMLKTASIDGRMDLQWASHPSCSNKSSTPLNLRDQLDLEASQKRE